MANAILGIWACVALLVILRILLRVNVEWTHKLYLKRNELFRIRTELVRLVAADKVSPRDATFATLYELVNVSIANTRKPNIFTFVEAARKFRIRARISELIEGASGSTPEIRHIAQNYCESLPVVLLRTSVLLRILKRLRITRHKSFPFIGDALAVEIMCEVGSKKLAA